MSHSQPKEYIGVDVGTHRVGIARGSSVARIAQPLKVVAADKALGELADLAAQADGIVVGLPRGLDGQETAQTGSVMQWVKQAKLTINKPFYWQDEALTSVTAQSKGGLTAEVDAVAASVILQDFLNSKEEDRVEA